MSTDAKLKALQATLQSVQLTVKDGWVEIDELSCRCDDTSPIKVIKAILPEGALQRVGGSTSYKFKLEDLPDVSGSPSPQTLGHAHRLSQMLGGIKMVPEPIYTGDKNNPVSHLLVVGGFSEDHLPDTIRQTLNQISSHMAGDPKKRAFSVAQIDIKTNATHLIGRTTLRADDIAQYELKNGEGSFFKAFDTAFDTVSVTVGDGTEEMTLRQAHQRLVNALTRRAEREDLFEPPAASYKPLIVPSAAPSAERSR